MPMNILKLIAPIAAKCTYLVDGPKTFKERFLPDCKKIDIRKHEIITLDAKSLYTSINTNRVISEILKIINQNQAACFKDKDENSRPLPFPERANFRTFLHSVLTKCNTFECQLGISKQKNWRSDEIVIISEF